MGASWGLTMTCLTRGNKNALLMKCHNPLVALLLSSHFRRWEAGRITAREMNQLADDDVVSGMVGSGHMSVVLWRAVTLQLLHKKQAQVKESISVSPDVVKGVNYDRIKRETQQQAGLLRRCLLSLFYITGVKDDVVNGIDEPDRRDAFAGLYNHSSASMLCPNKQMNPPSCSDTQATDEMSQNQRICRIVSYPEPMMGLVPMLKEYKSLQIALFAEVLSKRKTQLKRDDTILRNGLIRQARQDFLLLRDAYKTPAQLAEEKRLLLIGQRKTQKHNKVLREAGRLASAQAMSAVHIQHQKRFSMLDTLTQRERKLQPRDPVLPHPGLKFHLI